MCAHYCGHLVFISFIIIILFFFVITLNDRYFNINIPSSFVSITMHYYRLMLNGAHQKSSQCPQTDHNQDIKVKLLCFFLHLLHYIELKFLPNHVLANTNDVWFHSSSFSSTFRLLLLVDYKLRPSSLSILNFITLIASTNSQLNFIYKLMDNFQQIQPVHISI